MKCTECGIEFEPDENFFSFCPHCLLFRQCYWTWQQYQLLLVKLHTVISNEKLTWWDCTEIGNKDSACSWGLCGESFKSRGPQREDWHLCPMDRLTGENRPAVVSRSGCFYRCRAFSPEGKRPTREEALALTERLIACNEPVVSFRIVKMASRKKQGKKRELVEIELPLGTMRQESTHALAGARLLHPDEMFSVMGQLVDWPSGPALARESIAQEAVG